MRASRICAACAVTTTTEGLISHIHTFVTMTPMRPHRCIVRHLGLRTYCLHACFPSHGTSGSCHGKMSERMLGQFHDFNESMKTAQKAGGGLYYYGRGDLPGHHDNESKDSGDLENLEGSEMLEKTSSSGCNIETKVLEIEPFILLVRRR